MSNRSKVKYRTGYAQHHRGMNANQILAAVAVVVVTVVVVIVLVNMQ